MPKKKNELKSKEVSKSIDRRIEIVKKFSKEVLKKYGNKIKAIVMMGSVARKEFKEISDIDVFVIIDDTSMEMNEDIKNKIDEDLENISEKIPESKINKKLPNGKSEKINLLSVQPTYTLTEFWDYARVAHPIIYNFIKEGIPIYDTGFFEPIKKLLNMGKIPSTREAIESYMESAPKKIMRAKTVKLLMLAEDSYYAMLNTSQAVLMFMGFEPPVPNKAYEEVKKYLVDSGILEPEYAEWLKEIINIRKEIEHKKIINVSGSFVDEWLEKSEKYIDKMFNLLNALEMRKKEKILDRTHNVMEKAIITSLKKIINLPEDTDNEVVLKKINISLKDGFKKYFIDSKIIEPYYLEIWDRIEILKKLSKEHKLHKISEKEINDMRENVRKLIHELAKNFNKKN